MEDEMNAERLWDDGGDKSGPEIVLKAILGERQRCVDIAKARLPLYTLAQQNAIKEVISSIIG